MLKARETEINWNIFLTVLFKCFWSLYIFSYLRSNSWGSRGLISKRSVLNTHPSYSRTLKSPTVIPLPFPTNLILPNNNNNNNNNELYLHGLKRELQHCKSIWRTTKKVVIKVNQMTIISKLLIIDCLAFLNRMPHIVLIVCYDNNQ